jgi:hypothetical protein
MREELRIDPIGLLLRLGDEFHLEWVHHVHLRPELPQQVDNPRRLIACFDRDSHAPRGVAFHGPGQPRRRRRHDPPRHPTALRVLDVHVR